MTFRITSYSDLGARELDGSPESHDTIKNTVPAGWIWFGGLIFDIRTDATSCINLYKEHVPTCDRGACAFRTEAPEMKVIKRGGSSDPHFLIITRPVAVES
jgi:hypothetical protein